jgi:hypothetical protein
VARAYAAFATEAMILKIAAGMFFGIIAVLIMLKIPAWIRERRAVHVMVTLTPDTVVARCGKPISDNLHTFHTVSLRDMAYEGEAGKVILHFGKITKTSGAEKSWILNYMDDSRGVHYNKYQSQLLALPCLSKNAP